MPVGLSTSGRGAGIRTRDLFVPNEARCQTAPLPVPVRTKPEHELIFK